MTSAIVRAVQWSPRDARRAGSTVGSDRASLPSLRLRGGRSPAALTSRRSSRAALTIVRKAKAGVGEVKTSGGSDRPMSSEASFNTSASSGVAVQVCGAARTRFSIALT
jgi:hypothetical protein